MLRSLGTTVLVLLFTTLVLACALEAPGALASPMLPAQENGTFCASLSASSLHITLPCEPAPIHTGETVRPYPGVHLVWVLPQSIDHPPELSA